MSQKYTEKFFEGADFRGRAFKALIPKYYPRQYQKYIAAETELLKKRLKRTDRVLEAGVGIGRLIPILSPLVKEFVGVDRASLMLRKSKAIVKNFANARIVKGNLENLSQKFPKNYFDYCLCLWNTLGNVRNEIKVLNQLRRITSQSIFVTVYKKGALQDRINWYKTVGIKVKKIDNVNEIFYSESGLKSKSYSLEDLEAIGARAGLKVIKSKVLNKVMLWVEFVRI